MLPSRKDMEDAIGRIALTNDGRLLYRFLQIELMKLAPTSDGALPVHEGRRSFAHDIKVLMDRELAKLGPQRDRSDAHDPDAPAVTEPGKPVDSGGTRGTGRRVAIYPDDAAGRGSS